MDVILNIIANLYSEIDIIMLILGTMNPKFSIVS